MSDNISGLLQHHCWCLTVRAHYQNFQIFPVLVQSPLAAMPGLCRLQLRNRHWDWAIFFADFPYRRQSKSRIIPPKAPLCGVARGGTRRHVSKKLSSRSQPPLKLCGALMILQGLAQRTKRSCKKDCDKTHAEAHHRPAVFVVSGLWVARFSPPIQRVPDRRIIRACRSDAHSKPFRPFSRMTATCTSPAGISRQAPKPVFISMAVWRHHAA
jgi:hypothetical protein